MTNREKYFLAIISSLSIAFLTMVFSSAFGVGQLAQDIPELIKQIIPNLVASLLAFLLIYFFIDRTINNKNAEDLLSREHDFYGEYNSTLSVIDLRKIEETLKIDRAYIKKEIEDTFNAIRSSNNETDRVRFENILTGLYLRLNSIDSRVSFITDRLTVASEIELKEKEIEKLNNKVTELTQLIQSHKTTAREILENAKKI